MTYLAALPAWMQLIVWASIYGGLMALAALALRPVARGRVPARWWFVAWLLVVVRFIPLPAPQSKWSAFNWLPQTTGQTVTEQAADVGSAKGPGAVVPHEAAGKAPA